MFLYSIALCILYVYSFHETQLREIIKQTKYCNKENEWSFKIQCVLLLWFFFLSSGF